MARGDGTFEPALARRGFLDLTNSVPVRAGLPSLDARRFS